MDRDRFDRLSRLIATAGTRRDALRVLVTGAMVGLASTAEGNEALARKDRGRKQRKVRGQAEPPTCSTSTCNQNCNNKPLRGGSNLSKCNYNDRDLDGVQLQGSNLSKACFGNASLRAADLRSTNVSGACFCGADLSGADFRGSNVTAAQLACASVACDTILPNGKSAKPCAKGEQCCNGECVLTGSDPNNCGACGVECAACQFCNFGRCENLADSRFDCNRDPLQITQGRVCTTGPNTGICDGGLCNCGPGGRYDDEANVCLCNQTNTEFCESEFGNCCEIESTCLVGGAIFETEFQCPECGEGGATTNLCCEYLCAASGPGPRPKKYVCIDNAVPGQTRCDSSFQSCSFNDAQFVNSCSSCGSN